jgi:hypothetical protein
LGQGSGMTPEVMVRKPLDLARPPGRSEVVRRRTLVLVGLLVVAATAAVSGWLAVRSSGSVTALCTSAPAGFKERNIPKAGMTEATVVLTNFRFGRLDDFDGLSSRLRWPPHGIMIAVSNEGPDSTPPFRRQLRVGAADFEGLEGSSGPPRTWPSVHMGAS